MDTQARPLGSLSAEINQVFKEVSNMTTKQKLLTLFEQNKGIYLSGADIALSLSLSRTAIWKAVKTLQKEGYPIHAVPNKGYCLAEETDILSSQGIEKYLKPVCSHIKIQTVPATVSTNTLVREKAALGASEGLVIAANTQTQGRGRIGRSFFSPADTGIYMSLLLRPAQYSSRQAVKLTTMAAAAACDAIENISKKKAQIKWVNDIYMDNKKVSGILTEASFGLEDGLLEYAVLGIGINVYPPKEGFPKEIARTAGSVFSASLSDGKNLLAAEFLNSFMTYYSMPEQKDYIKTYRDHSLVIGKEIQVHLPGENRKALALDIDDQCRLLIKYEDGEIQRLSSGEISVALLDSFTL